MADLMKTGRAREIITARERLDREELRRLHESSALIVDDRRRRPLYFDGRFLAARDLTREQNYFLSRQSDLARTGGTGVVSGLMVGLADDGRGLRIDAGHGVTPSGETVILPEPLELPLANIPETQRLDAKFGILRRPGEPARARTGLFIVALRPVEFSANPIAAYPTSITGQRTIEDGDIVEGVVASLIPYPDPGGDGELTRRRARTARTLFVEASTSGFPVDALPLAMVALERNTLRWLDPFLVRREVGADAGDGLGLGLPPRAVREAYLLQYDRHLADVLRDRDASNRSRRFPATEHFLALPPAGRMPAQAINPVDWTQNFFPPGVTVDLSIVPEDEVPALVEESFVLPPLDLTLTGEALESTAVLVLIPQPRERVRTLRATLPKLARTLQLAAPGLIAQRKPLEVLRGIRLARLPVPPPQPDTVGDATWAAELAAATARADGLLWYIRRRNIDYRSDVVGANVRVTGDEAAAEAGVTDAMRAAGLEDRLNTLRSGATTLARADMVALLASPRFTESALLSRAVIHELETVRVESVQPGDPTPPEEKPIDRTMVLAAGERFTDPKLGEGITRLEAAQPGLTAEPALVDTLVASRATTEVDRIARELPEEKVVEFAAALNEAAASSKPIEPVLTRFSLSRGLPR
jgi:hypothetical protein